MTQRIFKANDPKDVKELFSLLPDESVKITHDQIDDGSGDDERSYDLDHVHCEEGYKTPIHQMLLKIDWGDLTEIKRPVDYEKYIGKIGWFWTHDQHVPSMLKKVDGKMFVDSHDHYWTNFKPLTLEEAKELIYEGE